ncbi:hypothetical protein BCON_0024g00230 [Botryotinia convoluta]|uniref:Uncharacterized protein n=1 Tax=Botryotinia convoluta TaxID=54673 RepID=A0A4Z1IYC4_9HELO|nr:hypothetical protein BCON_0024g00230 [Botryotinia convoluta]
MLVNSTTPIEADQQSAYAHSSSSSEKSDDAKSSPSITEGGVVLAKTKIDRDIAEQKRAEAVSLRISRGDHPEFLEQVNIYSVT